MCVGPILLACTSKRQTTAIRCLHSDSRVHSQDYWIWGGGKQAAVAKAVEEPHAVSLIECMDLPTTSIQLAIDSPDCLKEANTLLAGISVKGSCAVHTYIHM